MIGPEIIGGDNDTAYWRDYFVRLGRAALPAFASAPWQQLKRPAPAALATLSKGNLHNAQLLMAAALQLCLSSLDPAAHVAVAIEQSLIPLTPPAAQDIREYAKILLSEFRAHVRHLPAPEIYSQPLLVLGTLQKKHEAFIQCAVTPDCASLEIAFPVGWMEFVEALLAGADAQIASISVGTSAASSPDLRQLWDALPRRVQQPELAAAWEAVMGFVMDGHKSFFENGGDSIQAIRLIAKLRSAGYQADLSGLLALREMRLWDLQPATIAHAPKENAQQKNRYPLSAMQQQIWAHQQILQTPSVYHEQLLFRLSTCPPADAIAKAFAKIWNQYAQLRVNIVLQDGTWQQQIQNLPPDFRQQRGDVAAICAADLEEGFGERLMRCTLIQNENENHLLWSHHHVLLDGWSVGILINEFVQLLEAGTDALPAASLNFQQRLVEREQQSIPPDADVHWAAFFKAHEPMTLPQLRGERIGFQEIRSQLTAQGLDAIDAICAQWAISRQGFLLGILGLLQYGISGKPKTYLHGISSGRALIPEHAENGIGLFIRNLVIGLEVDADGHLHDFFQGIQRDFLEALHFEATPPSIIQQYQESAPDLLLVYENYPYDKVEGTQIHGELVHNHEWTGYPITLLLMPQGDGLQLRLIYDEGKFSAHMMAAFLEKYQRLINLVVQFPSLKLNDLSECERAPSPIQQRDFLPWYVVMDERLAHSAALLSSSLGDTEITQTSLPVAARNLAQYFSFLPQGERIALIGERNAHLPMMVYAILRAGYVYLPLNNAWPQERIRQTLEIAACKHVIVLGDEWPVLDADIALHRLELLTQIAAVNLPELPLDREAYVLFTSGSTGQPKGVSLTHGNLSAFLSACEKHVGHQGFSHVFSLTNIGFDLSIFENLYGLYVGLSTHVVDSVAALEQAILTRPNGLLNTVPSVLSKLSAAEAAQLAVVHTAGEPFLGTTHAFLKAHHPSLVIRNWYGPTETTTYSTVVDLSQTFNPSIGHALENESVEILDQLRLRQPDFLPGEIVIGGAGVAIGYLNGDESRFLRHHGRRLYCTGDRGYAADGEIFLLGRNDRQVKRLGQRFELAEVESGLQMQFQQLKRVLYLQVNPQYFVLFGECMDDVHDSMRAFLERQFPLYMLPDHIVLLPQFPENLNGKIDIAALVRMAQLADNENRTSSNKGLLATLQARHPIFAGLQGEFGFIAQGGDSIVALRIVGKLKSLGYRAELGSLLSAENLNQWFEDLARGKSEIVVHGDVVALTPIQQWFLQDYAGNRNHFNQSILLELMIPVSLATLKDVVTQMLAAFPIFAQVYEEGWKPANAPIIRTERALSAVEVTAICQSIQTAFDLQRGPVAGAALIDFDGKHLLFIALHHFYCDGFTWRVVLDQLQQAIQGHVVLLPGSEVFAKVQQQFQSLSASSRNEDNAFYGAEIFNPFKDWNRASYQESTYLEWEWDAAQTRTWIREWKAETRLNEKFLELFLMAWLQTNAAPVTPFFETHGRGYEGIPEISETAGWFTQFYPVLTREFPRSQADIAPLVVAQFAALPADGLTYMALAHAQKPPFPVLLNFLGNFDEGWDNLARPSNISMGEQVDPDNLLLGVIELNALIVDGKMKWMLRSHPQYDAIGLRTAIDFAWKTLSADNQSIATFVADEVDETEMAAILGLLDGLGE